MQLQIPLDKRSKENTYFISKALYRYKFVKEIIDDYGFQFLEKLSKNVHYHSVAAKQSIQNKNQTVSNIYIILKGEVLEQKQKRAFDETISHLNPGDVINDQAEPNSKSPYKYYARQFIQMVGISIQTYKQLQEQGRIKLEQMSQRYSQICKNPEKLELLEYISQLPLLHQLPKRDLQSIAHKLERINLTKGAYVYKQNDPVEYIYIIRDGQVQIIVDDLVLQQEVQNMKKVKQFIKFVIPKSEKNIIISQIGQDQIFGFEEVMQEFLQRKYSVIVDSFEANLYRLEVKAFKKQFTEIVNEREHEAFMSLAKERFGFRNNFTQTIFDHRQKVIEDVQKNVIEYNIVPRIENSFYDTYYKPKNKNYVNLDRYISIFDKQTLTPDKNTRDDHHLVNCQVASESKKQNRRSQTQYAMHHPLNDKQSIEQANSQKIQQKILLANQKNLQNDRHIFDDYDRTFVCQKVSCSQTMINQISSPSPKSQIKKQLNQSMIEQQSNQEYEFTNNLNTSKLRTKSQNSHDSQNEHYNIFCIYDSENTQALDDRGFPRISEKQQFHYDRLKSINEKPINEIKRQKLNYLISTPDPKVIQKSQKCIDIQQYDFNSSSDKKVQKIRERIARSYQKSLSGINQIEEVNKEYNSENKLDKSYYVTKIMNNYLEGLKKDQIDLSKVEKETQNKCGKQLFMNQQLLNKQQQEREAKLQQKYSRQQKQ